MVEKNKYIEKLYNAQGDFLGVFISATLWHSVENQVGPVIREALQKTEHQAKEQREIEPLQDWNLLVNNWDFSYPVDREVYCESCGNQTSDWMEDEPRKFKLKAANLGGLVSFQCQNCKSRIIKRHFKDHIKTETKPFIQK